MKPAKYEKRCTRAATRLAVICGAAIAVASLAASFALAPDETWSDDHADLATLSWLGTLWSGYFAQALKTFLASNGSLAKASAPYAAAIVATAEWVWNANVAGALGRSLLAAFLGTAIGGAVAYVIMITAAPIIDTRMRVDGMTLLTGQEGRKHIRTVMLREAGEDTAPGLEIAPGVFLSKFREIWGTLICGAIGSGKTRIVLFILDRMLALLRAFPQQRHRLLIHDTTGELLDGLPLADDEFAALHGARPGGWAWALGRDVLTASDAEAVGDALAPKTDESIWGSGASVFLAAALIKCQNDHSKEWGLPEFYDTLLEDPLALKPIYQNIYPVAASLIETDDKGVLSKTTVSFLLTFRAAVLRYLRPLAANWRSISKDKHFSFVEWLEDSNPQQPRIVLLQRSGKYSQLSAAWIGAVVDTITGHVNDASFPNSQTRRIFLMLEELPTLKLKNLSTLLDTGRNKSVGVFASVQEYEQLSMYGKDEAKSILKRFRTKIICQQVLDEAIDQFSMAHIGKKTVIDVTETTSMATTRQGNTVTKSTNETLREVPCIRGERLAFDLGVGGNRVKAVIAGIVDPVEMEWPITIWPRRRKT